MIRRMLVMIASWLLLFMIVGLDASFRGAELPLLKEAVVDETAHVATALLAVICFRPQAEIRIVVGAVLGSTAIDLDHLPAMAGSLILTAGTNRPYTHSLITVVLVTFLGITLPSPLRPFIWGVNLGVLSHLLRDMATGGVPLFWPLDTSRVVVPYHLYLIALVAAACMTMLRETVSVARLLIDARRPAD